MFSEKSRLNKKLFSRDLESARHGQDVSIQKFTFPDSFEILRCVCTVPCVYRGQEGIFIPGLVLLVQFDIRVEDNLILRAIYIYSGHPNQKLPKSFSELPCHPTRNVKGRGQIYAAMP